MDILLNRGRLFNAIADLYICDGFARLLRRRKVKLAMWLRELLKDIASTSLSEYRKQLANHIASLMLLILHHVIQLFNTSH